MHVNISQNDKIKVEYGDKFLWLLSHFKGHVLTFSGLVMEENYLMVRVKFGSEDGNCCFVMVFQ